jgi:hypothetical protein
VIAEDQHDQPTIASRSRFGDLCGQPQVEALSGVYAR